MKKYIKKEEVVKCEECKCLLYKDDAQEIKLIYISSIFSDDVVSYLYYCSEHKKPYDFIRQWGYKKIFYYRKDIKSR